MKEYMQIEECFACGGCVAVCPANAIILKEKAEIDESKCLKCKTCEKVCPVGLIKIE